MEIKADFVYVTKDFEELKARPRERYTYTLSIEISHPNETDENRIVVLSVDLLYVRIGKTAYLSVENQDAYEELQEYMTSVLEEIINNGIDSFCEDE